MKGTTQASTKPQLGHNSLQGRWSEWPKIGQWLGHGPSADCHRGHRDVPSPALDWLGVMASSPCIAHCALLPLLTLVLPAAGMGGIASESLSRTAIAIAAVVAAVALLRGRRAHGRLGPLVIRGTRSRRARGRRRSRRDLACVGCSTRAGGRRDGGIGAPGQHPAVPRLRHRGSAPRPAEPAPAFSAAPLLAFTLPWLAEACTGWLVGDHPPTTGKGGERSTLISRPTADPVLAGGVGGRGAG
jgi:hypothetical protein